MFSLETLDGQPVRNKQGDPFIYTSRELAASGKRVLENARKTTLKVVGA